MSAMSSAVRMAANMSMKACVVRSNTIRNSNKFSLARPTMTTTTRTLATTVSAAEAEASSEAATTTDEAKPKRRFPKKTVTVQESDLEVGKEFTGKVKSTTAYGAFVDFGAKNDGLVHISELQSGFVENVGDVVAVDQEVKIWIKSIEKGRISLTMKQPPTEAEVAQQAADQQAKFEARQAFKLQKEKQSEIAGNLKKGAVLEGCEVKSIQNYGIFVEIAEGVEGLVHISELSDDFGVEAKDIANVGDKVTVRVLGVDGSKVKLSMKEKLDLDEMASDMNVEVESSASAIQFAFKSIGLSADNFPQAKKSGSASASMSTSAAPTEEPAAAAPAATEEPAPAAAAAAPVAEPAAPAAAPAADGAAISAATVKELRQMSGAGMMDCKKALIENNGDVQKAQEWLRVKGMASADKKQGRIAAEGVVIDYIHAGSRIGVLVEVNCETDFVARGDKFKELAKDVAMQIAACPEVEYISADDCDPAMIAREKEIEMKKEDLQSKPENIREKIVQGRIDKMVNEKALLPKDYIKDTSKTVEELIKEATAELGEKISIRRFERFNLGEGIEKKESNFAAEIAEATAVKAEAPKPAEPKKEEPKDDAPVEMVAVSAAAVKELRQMSGAGMMDCKKALGLNGGDVQKAQEWLRVKGMASADKKQGRIAAEGGVFSYIHAGSKIGVLVEVNCETDFVARGDKFKDLAKDVAMQVAACPEVEYISADDCDPAMIAREKEIEMKKEDLQSKPENIREKIVQGRIDKMVNEKALLPKDYIKDTSKTVEELIKEATAELGEKISIRRFERFNLGEGIEKKESNFAAEIAAATGQA